MATRLQLKDTPSNVIEYAPIINQVNSGYTGVSGLFAAEQYGGGYRLRYQSNSLNASTTITTNTATNLTVGVQYRIKVNLTTRPNDNADTSLKIILGASDNGSNSFELINLSGTFEKVVTCSANNLKLTGSISDVNYTGRLFVYELSVTEVDPEDLTELDLYDDIPFPLTFKVDDIANPDTRSGAFSKTITIPGTKRNNKIFNHIFEIEADSAFNPNKKLDIRLVKDTYTQFDGILKLDRIILNDNKQVDYEVTLLSQVSNLFIELGDKLLEDLDFSEYNHELNATNQLNSWGTTFGGNGIVIDGVVTNNFTETYRSNPSPNGRGYVYCLMNNGKGNYTYNILADRAGVNGAKPQWRVADIGLGFYVRDYITRIAEQAGFTITSDFFDSALFKKLVIPPSAKDYLLSESQIAERLYNVRSVDKSIQLTYGNANSGIEQVDTVDYSDIQSDATGGYVSNTWYVQKGGVYNFKAQIGLRWEYSGLKCPSGTYTIGAETFTLPGGTPSVSNPVHANFYLSDESKLQVIRLRNGVSSILGEEAINLDRDTQLLTSATGASTTFTFDVAAENIECLPNDIIYVVVRAKHLIQTDGSPNYNPDLLNVDADGNYYPAAGMFVYRFPTGTDTDNFPTWLGNSNSFTFPFTGLNINYDTGGVARLVMREQYTFFNEVVNNGVTEGTMLDVNVYVPKNVKQTDFFKWVLKMFNCFVLVDPANPKNLLIEPREDFIGTDIVNWDSKLDVSREIEVRPLGELDAKTYVFKYTQDSDYINADYQEFAKEVFGTKTIEFDNDFLDGKKEISVGFSPTPVWKWYSNKPALPSILDRDANPIDGNIRIMFYNGSEARDGQWTHIINGTTYVSRNVPALNMYDDMYSPQESLEFSNSGTSYYWRSTDNAYTLTMTNNNLFNKYYSKYTTELTSKDSRLITAYFNLTPIDIYQLDFSKLYFFANHWCRLYAVEDYDPFVNATTKVTFLKFNDGVSFEPTYTPVTGGTGWYPTPTGGDAS